MKSNRLVIYFLTESVDSEKEKNEIEYLRQIGRLVLVSAGTSSKKTEGIKRINLAYPSPLVMRCYVLWSKICFLLGAIGNTSSDKYFTVRNVYTGNKIVRSIVNILWKIKVLPFV